MNAQTNNYLNHIAEVDWATDGELLLPLLAVLRQMHAKALALQEHVHAVSLTETDVGMLDLLEEANQKAGAVERITGEIRRLLRDLTNARTEIIHHHDRVIGAAEGAGYAIPEAAAKARTERQARRQVYEQRELATMAAENAAVVKAHREAHEAAGIAEPPAPPVAPDGHGLPSSREATQ